MMKSRSKTKVQIPVIDFEPFLKAAHSGQGAHEKREVAQAIGTACSEYGFFCLANHGIDPSLQKELETLSQDFFAREPSEKMRISMDQGGRAWRGYFPVGNELTSGFADLKEGLYFGSELGNEDPRVQKGLPLHGANLFPNIPRFREVVLRHMNAMTELGHQLMQAISLSLGLEANYFRDHYTHDPTTLFRIFHYPPSSPETEARFPWGVGEHTDYGVLTILLQDQQGGLQVKTKSDWIDVPPLENVFVCNVGDMLDFMTRGMYRSAPHRVKNVSGRDRYSFPFFFDPNFDVQMKPLPIARSNDESATSTRWDQENLHAFEGTYGSYLLKKVAKVFPELASAVRAPL